MKKKMEHHEFVTPEHLESDTKAWYETVLSTWELDEHHKRILALAAGAWDRSEQARRALEEHGLVFLDRFGSPHARPEIKIEHDSRILFSRLLRELGLDISPPDDPRMPRMNGRK